LRRPVGDYGSSTPGQSAPAVPPTALPETEPQESVQGQGPIIVNVPATTSGLMASDALIWVVALGGVFVWRGLARKSQKSIPQFFSRPCRFGGPAPGGSRPWFVRWVYAFGPGPPHQGGQRFASWVRAKWELLHHRIRLWRTPAAIGLAPWRCL